MKKKIAILLVLTMAFTMCFMTGCGKKAAENPYSDYTLAEYVTLPDYNAYDYTLDVAEVTDEQLQAEIDGVLQEFEQEEKITEGTVDKGDTCYISFIGTKEDGSQPDEMKAENTKVTLGAEAFIEGFQEACYGAKVGETVGADLVFPDPYELDESLSGKPVHFDITIESKVNTILPELTDDFVKENTDFKTVDEMTASLKENLAAANKDDAIYNLQYSVYAQILEEAEVSEPIPAKVDEAVATYKEFYTAIAEQEGYEWDKFLDEYFGWTQEEYDEQVVTAAEESVKAEMIIYALCEQEKVSVSDEKYNETLQNFIESYGYKDAAAFEEAAGFSVDDYSQMYGLRVNLWLQEVMDAITDRNVEA